MTERSTKENHHYDYKDKKTVALRESETLCSPHVVYEEKEGHEALKPGTNQRMADG